ncbi:MAG: alpha/beta hydrolase-fold protein [Xanthomonadales bacterium]|nr:alpha/beta hydrolase-fold protein [Xanthomonadales bacterium]
MNTRIQQLRADGPPSEEAIDAFVAENDFPLVEPGRVTFVFRGTASEVYLRRWISGHSTAQPLEAIEGTDLWALTMDLPDGSRFEYKFEVVRNGTRQLVLDELNGVLAHDPFGANSVCQGYGYERPDWTLHDPDSRDGALERVLVPSEAFGEQREIQVYLPARYRKSRSYPLLIVHDGVDYLRFAEISTVLDNLIHRLEVPAMVVALTQSPDRLSEYTASETHARFIGEELLPFMQTHFPLVDDAASRGLMGASLGAVATLHTAARFPDLFGRLLLQSGTFAFSDLGHHQKGPALDPVVDFVNDYREKPFRLAERIYMSCGVFESLIYENRSLLPVLQAQRMQVNFEEARDAHNWENWRDRLRPGLTWLFPGPLWMVYE